MTHGRVFGEPASLQQSHPARCVSDVGMGRMVQVARKVLVVRHRVRAETSALTEELDAEFTVALDMLGLQAWSLGSETVGPAEDRKFLAEGPCSTGESLGRVIGPGVIHEAYLEVQRREGNREIGEAGRELKTSADVVG